MKGKTNVVSVLSKGRPKLLMRDKVELTRGLGKGEIDPCLIYVHVAGR